MAVSILKERPGEVMFRVEIDPKTFEKAVIKEYQKVMEGNGEVEIPAMMSTAAFLKEVAGSEQLIDGAIQQLLPDQYTEALETFNITPMSFPKSVIRNKELGKPLVIDIRVLLEPEIELVQYKNIPCEYEEVVVRDADLEKHFSKMKERMGAHNDEELLDMLNHYDNIQQVKDELRESLELEAQAYIKDSIERSVKKSLIELNPFEIDDEIIEERVNMELANNRKKMGVRNYEAYMRTSGMSMASIKEQIRNEVKDDPKLGLILLKIAQQENFPITEEDIHDAIMQVAREEKNNDMGMGINLSFDDEKLYQDTKAELEQNTGSKEKLEDKVRTKKAMDFVIEHADKKVIKTLNVDEILPVELM